MIGGNCGVTLALFLYVLLQGSSGLVGFLMKSCSMLRNRMLADPSFLFKIGTEVCWILGTSFSILAKLPSSHM